MKRILRENGLSIVWLGLFFLTIMFGQSVTGWHEYNSDQQEHGEQAVTYFAYLGTPHFAEATMENWESEFLQICLYISLTSFLYQKGSAESKKLGEKEEVDRDPARFRTKKDAPWPVRKGGLWLALYQYSLSIAFALLFLGCFALHAAAGSRLYNQDQLTHHVPETVTTLGYLATSRFWFESFQNWQSEFFSVGLMVVFSIFLRHKGSPESKPVDAPHSQTGKD
ncbi:MAG: DUF6766 family protein [Acidobacteriota bacterium]